MPLYLYIYSILDIFYHIIDIFYHSSICLILVRHMSGKQKKIPDKIFPKFPKIHKEYGKNGKNGKS